MSKLNAPPLAGKLSVVATPIGNLEDLAPRARATLASCDAVAAEDTRHSGLLLQHFGIQKPLVSLHEHNEQERIPSLLRDLAAGKHIAIVSDAGTPGISDPGYRLIRAAAEAGIDISALPGPCAAIAALSVAGLATDKFVFEGFLPARSGQRQTRLAELQSETRTLIFYEAPHRIAEALSACEQAFGAQRRAVVARELTKRYETVYRGTLASLVERASHEPEMSRGEIVLLIEGAAVSESTTVEHRELDRVLHVLMKDLSLKQAAALAAQLCNCRENESYQRALALRREP